MLADHRLVKISVFSQFFFNQARPQQVTGCFATQFQGLCLIIVLKDVFMSYINKGNSLRTVFYESLFLKSSIQAP